MFVRAVFVDQVQFQRAAAVEVSQLVAAGHVAALLHDAAVGKCLLQFSDARVGDLGVAGPKCSQASQPLEMYQPVSVICECNPVHLGIFFNRLVVNLVRPKGFETNVTPVA